MTRIFFRSALAAASALALCTVPAMAQDKVAYDDYGDAIVVIAPGVHRERTGRSSSGIPIDTLSLSSVVSARDLDLRYDRDVRELHRRIDITAREACDELDRETMGMSLTSDRECFNNAVREARLDADVLIYNARG